MLDHDGPVAVVPAIVPTTIVMMPAVMVATLDDDLFSVGNGRRRNRNRTDGGNGVSKFLHDVLLLQSED